MLGSAPSPRLAPPVPPGSGESGRSSGRHFATSLDAVPVKAELARRAGVKPEAIRRLFSAEKPNPTLTTLVALAGVLDLEIRPTPRRGAPTSRARSAASGTRRRSA